MKIRDPDLSANAINQEHLEAGLPPIETLVTEELRHPHLVWAAWATGIILIGLILYLSGQFVVINGVRTGEVLGEIFSSNEFWSAAAVGFVAQMIDGALGMAYGISATTFLLSTGATPAVASASVHIAEVFTTGLSGISHVRLGNVNRDLFLRLLVPGIVGATVGVLVVTQIDGKAMKPFISGYLLLMGMYILWHAYRRRTPNHEKPRHVAKLALFGGFVDAAGGGGWGPVVTTSLVGSGHDPRTT
ncbi:MAG: sulfite exporter TauE/SafE family protein, partial [Burkholderiales bacterium]